MVEPILALQGITKKFPGVIALDDVSLELHRGEILALVGENGAGKSTLMKILSGVYPFGSYTGTVILAGKEMKFSHPAESKEAGVAMIYQEISIELDVSVAENIMLGMLPTKGLGIVDWKLAYEKAEEVLKTLGVDLDVRTPTRKLSASFQQLVCIARAMVRNPRVLILDEPTSALTESETTYLIDLLKKLKERDISCIYISHKLDEVIRVADRIVVLRDGRVVSECTEGCFDSKKIVEDIIGRELGVMYPERKGGMGEVVLEVEGIRVPHPYLPQKFLIEDVSFSVRKGEILGLAGLVGSGRSELLKCIFGAYERCRASITLAGKKVSIGSPNEAIRLGIGLLTEDRKKDGYVGTMNVRENMSLSVLRRVADLFVLNGKRENGLVRRFIGELSIKCPSERSSILTLSGGNQQKVLLSRWLMTEPKVLFLDEPTRGVDVGAKAEIYRIMRDLSESGIAIVMISSELPELLKMCDRFIVLGKGKVQAEFDKNEASETKIMHAAAFG